MATEPTTRTNRTVPHRARRSNYHRNARICVSPHEDKLRRKQCNIRVISRRKRAWIILDSSAELDILVDYLHIAVTLVITGFTRLVHQIQGTNFHWPNFAIICKNLQNFVIIRQEVSEISPIENLCSPKSGPKFTKIFRGCYSTKPLTNPNFVAIG